MCALKNDNGLRRDHLQCTLQYMKRQRAPGRQSLRRTSSPRAPLACDGDLLSQRTSKCACEARGRSGGTRCARYQSTDAAPLRRPAVQGAARCLASVRFASQQSAAARVGVCHHHGIDAIAASACAHRVARRCRNGRSRGRANAHAARFAARISQKVRGQCANLRTLNAQPR